MIKSDEISKSILNTAINDNKISHAYLFQINDSSDNNELIFSFVKNIICPYKKNKVCKTCNICKRIDDGNYTELKIINPDGMYIKKEQLLDLQNSFNKKAVESDYLVYIINEAEKMNKSAANTILKFLEEPEKGIVAILTTNNIHNVIETIVSRCQIINLKNGDININYSQEQIDKTFELILNLEENNLGIFKDLDQLWTSKFTDKKEVISFFEISLFIYTDLLNYYIKGDFEILNNKRVELKQLVSYNNQEKIYKKINIIMEINDQLKYNINTNLLMDKFIIEFNRGE